MVRQISLLSVLASSAALNDEHQALMQARIGAEGLTELFYDESAATNQKSSSGSQLQEELDELSRMKIEHTMSDSQFQLAVHHKSGVSMFQLEETHLFGEGVKSYGLNGSRTILKPTFQTFRSTEGPLARVQLNDDGTMVGWVQHKGQLVQFQKRAAESSAAIVYLKHKVDEEVRRTETKIERADPAPDPVDMDSLNKHKNIFSSEDGKHQYAVDTGHECGHATGDGMQTVETEDHATWCPESGGVKKGGGKGGKRKGRKGGRKKKGKKGRGKGGKGDSDETDDVDDIDDDDLDEDMDEEMDDSEGDVEPPSLLQSTWSGQQWIGSCFPDDASPHVMKVGIVVDQQAKSSPDEWSTRHGYSYHGDGTWQSEAAYQVNQATMIYQNQMNIELQMGDDFPLTYDSDAAAPEFLRSDCEVYKSGANNALLSALTSFIASDMPGTGIDPDNVVSTHVLTGCNPGGFGSVGVAWVGTLCDPSGYGSGIDHINAGWTTYAHELGHNFGASHSFEDGQGSTGGIMDYGDGTLDGEYQFNTKYRKSEVCGRLTEWVNGNRCSSTAFYKTSDGASPRRRTAAPTAAAPTPAPTTPRRRRAGTTGCEDRSPTNIKLNGVDAQCSQLSNFCASYSFVRDVCPATCGECTTPDPTPAPTPAPTSAPTAAPSPGPTPAPVVTTAAPTPAPTTAAPTAAPTPAPTTTIHCFTNDVQSTSNCGYWESRGFCAPDSRYHSYMLQNCCVTCGGAGSEASTPPPGGSGGGSGECVAQKSVPNDCSPCRESSQCVGDGFCCPFMKKCVASGSQGCSYPIADCSPRCHDADNCPGCHPSDGSSYADWGSPTC